MLNNAFSTFSGLLTEIIFRTQAVLEPDLLDTLCGYIVLLLMCFIIQQYGLLTHHTFFSQRKERVSWL